MLSDSAKTPKPPPINSHPRSTDHERSASTPITIAIRSASASGYARLVAIGARPPDAFAATAWKTNVTATEPTVRPAITPSSHTLREKRVTRLRTSSPIAVYANG